MPSTRKWLEDERKISKSQQKIWFGARGHDCFQIVEDDIGVPIGLARIKQCSQREWQIGLDLFAKHRGRGLGKIVFEQIVKGVNDSAQLLSLWVFADNIPAVRVYEASGFQEDHSTESLFLKRDWCKDRKKYRYMRMVKYL
jgi:RimJ/RimL family protein N-acetyltransferase